MAVFRYVCAGGHRRPVIQRRAPAEVQCRECPLLMTREVNPPSNEVLEEFDNGVQGRRTVRYADADRAWAQHRRAGKAGQEK